MTASTPAARSFSAISRPMRALWASVVATPDGGVHRLVELADGAAPAPARAPRRPAPGGAGPASRRSCRSRGATLSYCAASSPPCPRCCRRRSAWRSAPRCRRGCRAGTRPPSVTSAMVAPSSVLQQPRRRGTRGKSGSGTSLVNGPAGELVEQHRRRALGGVGADHDVAGHPAREVALGGRRADRARRRASLSPSATSRRASSSMRAASAPVCDDVDLAAIELDAGVLRVHAGHGGNLRARACTAAQSAPHATP